MEINLIWLDSHSRIQGEKFELLWNLVVHAEWIEQGADFSVRVVIIQLICEPNVNQPFESHSTRRLKLHSDGRWSGCFVDRIIKWNWVMAWSRVNRREAIGFYITLFAFITTTNSFGEFMITFSSTYRHDILDFTILQRGYKSSFRSLTIIKRLKWFGFV